MNFKRLVIILALVTNSFNSYGNTNQLEPKQNKFDPRLIGVWHEDCYITEEGKSNRYLFKYSKITELTGLSEIGVEKFTTENCTGIKETIMYEKNSFLVSSMDDQGIFDIDIKIEAIHETFFLYFRMKIIEKNKELFLHRSRVSSENDCKNKEKRCLEISDRPVGKKLMN